MRDGRERRDDLGLGAYDTAFSFGGNVDTAGVAVCGSLLPLAQFACACPAGRQAGRVWGSGPYTADSDICSAASMPGSSQPRAARFWCGEPRAAKLRGLARQRRHQRSLGAFGSSFAFGPKD
jgi:hypothetical protein